MAGVPPIQKGGQNGRSSWFDVDRAGLARILGRRPKHSVLAEIVQNAWDERATDVAIAIQPVPGAARAVFAVSDNSPDGWDDLSHAFTMFAPSGKAGDPNSRGRFNLGEKLVLAFAVEAQIETMSGTVYFDEERGRVCYPRRTRENGTLFTATLRMTRDEIADTIDHFDRLIPPEGVRTTVNAKEIVRPATIASFQACLQTEVAKDHPELGRQIVRTMLVTRVDAYSAIDGEGEVLELGIPVCPIDLPWRLDVQQKVPTSLERDSVTDAFRRSLVVSAANAMAERMTAEDAQSTWATEALSDARIGADACYEIVNRRFGPRTVVATPGDPIANATAEANGCVVVHGGAMPAAAWSNIRKHGTMFPASVAFPTRKPEDRSKQEVCPLCKQAVR